jgi:tryptophanyl-tRNA synthetase
MSNSSSEDTNQNENSSTFAAAEKRSDEIWGDLKVNPGKYRMLTGDRPTGSLHIGHYFGTLKNRVMLQNMGIETFIVIADYQVLTDRDSAASIGENVREIILDYMAVGLDPFSKKTTIFAHSHVPELNQLLLPFLTLVSVAELERNPTVKEEAKAANISSMNASMLTYPVHQAADILFCKGNIVPVGKDQLPHLEISRKIARRFNDRFSPKKRLFPEPSALLAEVPHILGLDGDNKMSKSRNNAVFLKWTADETAKAVKRAKTDSERTITFDPINRPEVANMLKLLSLCTAESPQSWADKIGDGGGGRLKQELADALNAYFAPMRAKRLQMEADRSLVATVLKAGNERARAEAAQTLAEVRRAMNMDYGL